MNLFIDPIMFSIVILFLFRVRLRDCVTYSCYLNFDVNQFHISEAFYFLPASDANKTVLSLLFEPYCMY